LVTRAAVAPEQNKTERVGGAEEAAFVCAQLFAGTTQNDRARCVSRRGRRFTGQ